MEASLRIREGAEPEEVKMHRRHDACEMIKCTNLPYPALLVITTKRNRSSVQLSRGLVHICTP